MHTIEYDGASPAPWKITTDDGTEWHAATDAEAAIELAREPMPVKLVLTALCALGTVTGLLIVRAVYRRRAESAEPEDQS